MVVVVSTVVSVILTPENFKTDFKRARCQRWQAFSALDVKRVSVCAAR